MGIDAQMEILRSPGEYGGPLSGQKPELDIHVLTGTKHKAEILDVLTQSGVNVSILSPHKPPPEPNYILGEPLIILKAVNVFQTMEENGRKQKPGEIWVVNDVNVSRGIAGAGRDTPVRKPEIDKNLRHEEQLEQLTNYIVTMFKDYKENTLVVFTIEALSAWRVAPDLPLITFNEPGSIQLPPWLVAKLQDSTYVREYLEFCSARRENIRKKGKDPGASNVDVAGGIRWGDLLTFIGYKEPTEGEPARGKGVLLSARTVEGQSARSAITQLVRGFNQKKVNEILPIVQDFLEHPNKHKKNVHFEMGS